MHANNTAHRADSPTTSRAAAIRQSMHLYAVALGLSDEQVAEVEQMAVDLYDSGDSAAWAISLAKSRAQEMSRAG